MTEEFSNMPVMPDDVQQAERSIVNRIKSNFINREIPEDGYSCELVGEPLVQISISEIGENGELIDLGLGINTENYVQMASLIKLPYFMVAIEEYLQEGESLDTVISINENGEQLTLDRAIERALGPSENQPWRELSAWMGEREKSKVGVGGNHRDYIENYLNARKGDGVDIIVQGSSDHDGDLVPYGNFATVRQINNIFSTIFQEVESRKQDQNDPKSPIYAAISDALHSVSGLENESIVKEQTRFHEMKYHLQNNESIIDGFGKSGSLPITTDDARPFEINKDLHIADDESNLYNGSIPNGEFTTVIPSYIDVSQIRTKEGKTYLITYAITAAMRFERDTNKFTTAGDQEDHITELMQAHTYQEIVNIANQLTAP